MTIEDLQRFALPGLADIEHGRHGLAVVRVRSPLCTGEVYLHGGHVTSWVPAGGDDVLFVSKEARFEPGRAIRGGIPVCFPWFGALDGRPTAPAHGCVRTKAWRLDAIERTAAGVRVSMSTTSDAESRAYWPFEFRLENRVTFGHALTLELTATNTGTVPFTFEEALHTYYRVGSIHDVRVTGLEDVPYQDALDGRRERCANDAIAFTGEVDRIYLGTAHPIVIEDHGTGRTVSLDTEASKTTVVWNPWIRKARALVDLDDDEWTAFVCVESCNVAPTPVPLPPEAAHAVRLVVRAGSSGRPRFGLDPRNVTG